MKLVLKLKTNCSVINVLVILILNSNASVFKAKATEKNFTYIYRSYLRNMIDIMDQEEQPCVNFFKHACGNFENFRKQQDELPDSDEEDVVPYLYNMQDYYKFFNDHKQHFKTVPGILVRNVYNLCQRFVKNNQGERKIWLRMINDIPFLRPDHDLLSKWPFLEYQWKIYEPQLELSWPSVAAEFTAHGLYTFLHIFFVENTIYVRPNDELECLDLNELKTSLRPLLGKRHAQIADIIGGELWVFCRQLKGEVAISGLENTVTNLYLTAGDIMTEYFQRLALRWNFTDSELSKARQIAIHNDKLGDIMVLLSKQNPRIIYNFILWQAYQQITNIDDCFQLTQEFDGLLQVEYWNWHAFKPHFSRDVALASYLFHTTRFQRYYRQFISSTSWERLFQNRSERKDLNIERSIKNYAKQYLDLESYASTYKLDNFSNGKPTFYAHLLELRRLNMRYAFLNPYKDSEDLEFFQEFINFTILLIYRPRLHYFASHDREMWEKSKTLQNSDGFYEALDCLSHQTALNEEDSNLFRELSMEQVNEIYKFYTSFIEALSDYKFWLESENIAIAEEGFLNDFELDSFTVVFYAVAHQFCGRHDTVYSDLINRSYMNMPEFQEAFQCMSIDEMNPVTKCMIN